MEIFTPLKILELVKTAPFRKFNGINLGIIDPFLQVQGCCQVDTLFLVFN